MPQSYVCKIVIVTQVVMKSQLCMDVCVISLPLHSDLALWA